jgi:hypothetical protein
MRKIGALRPGLKARQVGRGPRSSAGAVIIAFGFTAARLRRCWSYDRPLCTSWPAGGLPRQASRTPCRRAWASQCRHRLPLMPPIVHHALLGLSIVALAGAGLRLASLASPRGLQRVVATAVIAAGAASLEALALASYGSGRTRWPWRSRPGSLGSWRAVSRRRRPSLQAPNCHRIGARRRPRPASASGPRWGSGSPGPRGSSSTPRSDRHGPLPLPQVVA